MASPHLAPNEGVQGREDWPSFFRSVVVCVQRVGHRNAECHAFLTHCTNVWLDITEPVAKSSSEATSSCNCSVGLRLRNFVLVLVDANDDSDHERDM